MSRPFTIDLPAGTVLTDSALASMGRFVNSDGVRWYRAKAQKIGGSQPLLSTVLDGVTRGMCTWNDLTARELIAAGTAAKLWAIPNTDYQPIDITPAGLAPGPVDPQPGFGWGADVWGSGTWGSPRLKTTFQTDPRIWSVDNFGKLLIACPADDVIYQWDPTIFPTVRATALAGGPAAVRGFYITAERFIIAFGTTGPAGEPQNLMRIYWCAQGLPTDWITTHTPADLANLPGAPAGSRQIQVGTRIVAGVDIGNFISLIWTDAALYTHQYTGGQFTFTTQLAGTRCGLLSRYGFAIVAGIAYWISAGNFWLYNGSIQRIPNADDITQWFFDQIRADGFVKKCFAYYNVRYSEVWFVAVAAGGVEPALAAVYNIQTQTWFKTTLPARSAATAYSQIEEDPILAGADMQIHQHELGLDYGTTPLPWSLTTGFFEIADGAQSIDVFGFMPDMERQIGDISITIATLDRTPQPVLDSQVETFGPTDGLIDLRISGREISLQMTCGEAGCDFRLGKPKVDFLSSGERR